MKKTLYQIFLRKFFLKHYLVREITIVQSEAEKKRKLAKSHQESQKVFQEEWANVTELQEWLDGIEDEELIQQAKKLGIYLSEIPLVEKLSDEESSGYWKVATFGETVLFDCYRKELKSRVKKEMAISRKERRETYEFYFKIFGGVVSAITGLGGTVIGIISLLKK